MEIVRAKGGTAERKVDLADIQIPDMWHLAMWLQDCDKDRTNQIGKISPDLDKRLKHQSELLLETWYLCGDLLRALKEQPKFNTYKSAELLKCFDCGDDQIMFYSFADENPMPPSTTTKQGQILPRYDNEESKKLCKIGPPMGLCAECFLHAVT